MFKALVYTPSRRFNGLRLVRESKWMKKDTEALSSIQNKIPPGGKVFLMKRVEEKKEEQTETGESPSVRDANTDEVQNV